MNVRLVPSKIIGDHTKDNIGTTDTTLTKPDGANAILIQALDANATVVLDTAATTANGFLLTASDKPDLYPVVGAAIKVQGAASGTNIVYQWCQV